MKLNLSLSQPKYNLDLSGQLPGYISLTTMVFAGSSAPIFIRLAQNEGIPSQLVVTMRLLVAFALLTPILLRRYYPQLQTLNRRDIALTIFTGLWLALHFMGYIGSVGYTSILISGVISSTSPLAVALLEMFVFKDIAPRIVWMGLALSIIGGFTIGIGGNLTTTGSNPLLGTLLAGFGAFAFAVYLIAGRPVQRKISLIPYVWMVYGWAGLFALLMTIFSGASLTGHTSEGYIWAILVAVIPQLIGHSSINFSVRFFSPTYVSIVLQLTVVFSSIIAIFMFDEIPQSLQIMGSSIILIGAMLASIGQGLNRKRDKH